MLVLSSPQGDQCSRTADTSLFDPVKVLLSVFARLLPNAGLLSACSSHSDPQEALFRHHSFHCNCKSFAAFTGLYQMLPFMAVCFQWFVCCVFSHGGMCLVLDRLPLKRKQLNSFVTSCAEKWLYLFFQVSAASVCTYNSHPQVINSIVYLIVTAPVVHGGCGHCQRKAQ